MKLNLSNKAGRTSPKSNFGIGKGFNLGALIIVNQIVIVTQARIEWRSLR